MKWRRDTCLPRPSSFAHLKLARLLVLAQGVAEGSLRCRQFWSNICPRKNKSPLSLTTGRASLVSNRALLNRRRITDPRELVHSDDLPFLPFALAQSLQSSYPARPIFFFHWQQNRKPDMARRRLTSHYLSGFYRKFYRIFTIVISLPSFFRVRLSTTISDERD